jgi:hypothetical protein
LGKRDVGVNVFEKVSRLSGYQEVDIRVSDYQAEQRNACLVSWYPDPLHPDILAA